MQFAEVFEVNGVQAVKLPVEFRFLGSSVSVRRDGDAVILEPVRPSTWPTGFFDAIAIDDPAFKRPAQHDVPPAPSFD